MYEVHISFVHSLIPKHNHHFKYKLSDGVILEKTLDIDKELKYAYDLKELYMIFNNSKYDIDKISTELSTIINVYKLSGISSFMKIGNALSNWKEEIISSFHTYDGRMINKGPIEGRNKYVRIIITLAMRYKILNTSEIVFYMF